MTDNHISENEVQLAVLDSAALPAGATQHLAQCATCQARVKEYELLFSSVEALSKPSFDFDVANMVMPLLPEKKKSAITPALIIAVILMVCGMCIVPFFLFNLQVDELWPSISPWLMGILAVVALTWIGISLADMYSRYKARLRALDLSN